MSAGCTQEYIHTEQRNLTLNVAAIGSPFLGDDGYFSAWLGHSHVQQAVGVRFRFVAESGSLIVATSGHVHTVAVDVDPFVLAPWNLVIYGQYV